MALFLHIRNHQQNHLRRNRVFRDRLHPLDAYNDTEIISRYRLSRPLILQLYDDIRVDIEPQTRRSHAIPGILQLFSALRFYATGTFQAVIGDSVGVHKCSVCRIVTRVTDAICRLKNRYIRFPRTAADIATTKQTFHDIAHFPQVIGAVDGTLIPIKRPKINEHLYINRKGVHSLNVLAVCNADMVITTVVAKYPGGSNEGI